MEDDIIVETPEVKQVDLMQGLGNAIFGVEEQAVVAEAKPIVEVATPVTEVIDTQVAPVFDEAAFIKDKLGFDNLDAVKQEIEALRKFKENPLGEYEWKNEQSKTLFEHIDAGNEDGIFDYIKTKKELAAIDNLSPEDVIKLNIKYNNKHFSKEDVQDVYEENYRLPRKPEQGVAEEETDFEVREAEWKEQVERINRKIQRDSFAAKVAVSKYKEQVVLPKLSKAAETTQEQIQEQLDATAKFEANFKAQVETNYKNFGGFKTSYKDGEVDVPIVYEVSEDERVQSKSDVLNYDKENLLYNRWFDKDGNPQVNATQEDIYLLKNRDKVFQAIAQNAVNSFKDNFIKTKKNITDFGAGSGGSSQAAAAQIDLMQELGTAVYGN